jgi:hypothetical protein
MEASRSHDEMCTLIPIGLSKEVMRTNGDQKEEVRKMFK